MALPMQHRVPGGGRTRLGRRQPTPFTPISAAQGPIRCPPVQAAAHGVIAEIQSDLRSKRRSAVEIVQQYLDQAQQSELAVGSFISMAAEQALEQAKALDDRIAREGTEGLGPLAGVPIAIKDNICTQGMRTTAGSQILVTYQPPFDATSVSKLRQAGAIIIGKTNMDEFGMGSSTENSSYKITRNPRDTTRVPGGSSGGSAAAVAAGQCPVALGSDTGGSIRQPASFCGVVGLKPTYGRVSRYGLIAYASSLDCIGPMATTVSDIAHIMNVIAGHDSLDATTSATPVPDFTQGLLSGAEGGAKNGSKPLQGKRLAYITDTLGKGCAPEVRDAVRAAGRRLEELGATVGEVSLPTFDSGLPAYYVLAVSEASSNLARYDGVRYGMRNADARELNAMYASTREAGLGPEVKRRILMGTYALSAGYYDAVYKKAQQVRTLIKDELSTALSQYDALLCPAAPTLPYKLGDKVSDPLAMYLGDLATVNINLAGLPALVLPVSYVPQASGPSLPVGLQLVGRYMDEAGLLQVAHVLEQSLALSHPPLQLEAAAQPALV